MPSIIYDSSCDRASFINQHEPIAVGDITVERSTNRRTQSVSHTLENLTEKIPESRDEEDAIQSTVKSIHNEINFR